MTDWAEAAPDRVVTMSKPPTTNHLWRHVPGRKRIRSAEYTAWLNEAGWDVKSQIVGAAPIDCRFNVLIEVPISRRDTGNWEKATMDLCEHVGLVSNDGNVNELRVRPTDRQDVMVAIYCLPDMGGVRKAARARYVGVARKMPDKKAVARAHRMGAWTPR